MNRKIALLTPLLLLFTHCGLSSKQEDKYPYILPPLPYAYNALEPYIDELTMHVHHDAHHKAYVDNLNAALKDAPELQNKTLEWLLKNLDKIQNVKVRTAIRNNGGGHWNHRFFWEIMGTQGRGEPRKLVLDAINKKFGNFEKFKELFTAEAKKVFGSGWAWLAVDQNGDLVLLSSANQDSPIAQNLQPILALDVWEHAYYLKYQNKRPDYITSWWQVVNWDKVEDNYRNTRK